MADYTQRTVRMERVEFSLPLPSNLGELNKMLRGVERGLGAEFTHPMGDAAHIRADEDELVIWWERPA